MVKKRRIITYSFRPGKDDDLEAAVEREVKREGNRSHVLRKALQAYLFPNRPERQLEANLDDVELEAKEKTAEEIDGDLDSLLNDF